MNYISVASLKYLVFWYSYTVLALINSYIFCIVVTSCWSAGIGLTHCFHLLVVLASAIIIGSPFEAFEGSNLTLSNLSDRPFNRKMKIVVRSTSKSRPNNIRGGKMSVRTSVHPSTKSFFDLNEIWYIGRGR